MFMFSSLEARMDHKISGIFKAKNKIKDQGDKVDM